MSHIITYTEEIEEHGFCQERPTLNTGDKYLYEVDGKKRLRIVLSVHFDKYVWEDVAQWTTIIKEYFEEEYTLCTIPINNGRPQQTEIPVFVANGLAGVLSCNKDLVCGELVIPSKTTGNVTIKGVAAFGFYDCQQLTKVTISPMVVIVYGWAFAKSGIKDMVFNEEVAVIVHITALNDCDGLPKFDRLFDFPFSGKYLFHGGEIFKKWEEDLIRTHFLVP